MLDSTMLDDVASTCWIRLAGPLACCDLPFLRESSHFCVCRIGGIFLYMLFAEKKVPQTHFPVCQTEEEKLGFMVKDSS